MKKLISRIADRISTHNPANKFLLALIMPPISILAIVIIYLVCRIVFDKSL